MTKREVFNMLKTLDKIMPREAYSVVYGAALVINGVKEETSDIDINVESPEVFHKLMEAGIGRYRVLPTGAEQISINEYVDLHFGGLKKPDVAVGISRGFRVATVKAVRDEKLLRAREKDLNDVKKIDEWIVQQWLKANDSSYR